MKKKREFYALLLVFALEPDVGVGGGCFVFSAVDVFDIDAVLDFLFQIVERECVFLLQLRI